MTGAILVVEDDPSVAAVLQRVLRRLDQDVTCVDTGAAAVSRLGDGGISLVVLDLGLPDLDGTEVCRQVREGGYAGRILALSARYGAAVSELALAAGADAFMPKPFSVADLDARVRALLS